MGNCLKSKQIDTNVPRQRSLQLYPSKDYDYLIKLLLIGDMGVGKSCCLSKYVDNTFTDVFINTIGVDFQIKTINLDGKIIKFQIWDTAGQERFRTITSSYYRGMHGIFSVYDVTNEDTFFNIQKWMQEIDKYAHENVSRILIANKVDLSEDRKVSLVEGKNKADYYNIKYVETSAKNGYNIEKMFIELAKTILEKN